MSDRPTPSIGQVTFEVHASPDSSPVVPLRLAHEPAEGFEDYIAAIRTRVTRGDTWAWCELVVICRFGEYSGKSTCLRQVSVSSAEDFTNTHPYYEVLRREAFERLMTNMILDETTFAQPPIDPSPSNVA